jgi:hypothetical protein
MLNPIITPPRVPLVDPDTGLISRAWYLFFLSLNNIANDVVNDPVVDPNAESLIASYDAMLQTLTQEVQTQPTQESALDQIAELQKQVQAQDLYDCCNDLISQFTELQKQVDGLQMQPPVQEIAGVTISPPATNNVGLAINTPIISARSFAVPSDAQVLFAEPIHMNEGTWLEVFTGAVLREVR